jgi:hypothetical protein
MCNAFGMAADERSSVATERELARKRFFSNPFAPQLVLVNSSTFVSESDNGISEPLRLPTAG